MSARRAEAAAAAGRPVRRQQRQERFRQRIPPTQQLRGRRRHAANLLPDAWLTGLRRKCLLPRAQRSEPDKHDPGKHTAEVHDYHDVLTGVLASSLAKRAPGYISLGFPDPRRQREPAPIFESAGVSDSSKSAFNLIV